MIVVDSNIIASYFVQGPVTGRSQALRATDPAWIVPPLWSVEFQNILWKYVRLRGMPAEHSLDVMNEALAILAPNERTPEPALCLAEAVRAGITAYDAQYIVLAKQYDVACVTNDGELLSKYPGIAVSLPDIVGDTPPPRVHESRAAYGVRRKKIRTESTSSTKLAGSKRK